MATVTGILAGDTLTLTNALITGACDLTRYQQINGFLNIPAMALVAILTVLLVVGIQESARFNNIVVFAVYSPPLIKATSNAR